ncbi:MAG: peptidoglycan DD-metalloendopeptidase family protein [Proteobacteria bacterium]|nr:peptidoglycan DD-metalloendopeptidase family protein [Pseudomonadota bacterium]
MRIFASPILRMVLLAAAAWLAGCASNPPAQVVDLSLPNENATTATNASGSESAMYRVVRGDTLYSIAFKHGLDYRDLATWNGIASPYRILVGQELRLSAPPAPVVAAASPATPEPQPGQAVTTGIGESTATTAPLSSASAAAQKPSAFEPIAAQAATAPAPVPAAPASAAPATAAAEKPPVATPAPKPIEQAPPITKPVAPLPTKPAESTAELNAGGVTWRWPADGKVVGTFVAGDQTKQGLDIAGSAGDPVRAAADGEVVYSGNGLIGYGELVIVKHNANFLSAYGHNRKRLVKEGDRVKAGQQIAEMGATSASRDELHFEIRKNGKPVNPLDYLPAQ